MKKKAFLLLLPLTLSLVGCGKDVDAKMNNVDLARLLNDEEIANAYEAIKENYADKLSKCEINTATLDTDLLNQKTEESSSVTISIKGDEYAEITGSSESKVKNNFYSFTNKTVENRKVAAFGKYFITYASAYNDGQKDNAEESLSYMAKGTLSISEAAYSLPFDSSSLNMATIGVDKRDNIYAVYSVESISTFEGHDKDGKDATFKTKTTYEISGKFGTLKEPKVESYKIVEKREVNFDKELKIYSKYQLIKSDVASYKFEYKNRGKDEGKDAFIDGLPKTAIQSASISQEIYEDNGSGGYALYDYKSINNNVTYMKKNLSSGSATIKASKVNFARPYAYSFINQYTILTIDKSAKEIFESNGADEVVILSNNANFTTSIATSGKAIYVPKVGLDNYSFDVQFVSNGTTLTVSII